MAEARGMWAGRPFSISSWMTSSPTRLANRSLAPLNLGPQAWVIKEAAMQRYPKLLLAAAVAAPLSAPPAYAHAFLDHAVPGVGMTVSGPVREIRIWYTQ